MTAEKFEGDWDHVIVGAGSAGCVLANRLSADPRRRVLLLESGGEARHPYLHVPAGFLKTFRDPRFNWNFVTEPGPGVGGRPIHTPRGRVLGGSSAINGHLWVRGSARDFDDWAQAGCRGWSHADVLPLFPKEHWPQIASTNPLERLNKEVKRRADVVGIFPNDEAIIRLVGAQMMELNDEWAVARRYMSMEALARVSHTDTVRLPAVVA